MSRAVSKRCRELHAMVRTVVHDLGFGRKAQRVERAGPPCVWAQRVDFSERDFACRTRREVSMLVLERVTAGLAEAWQEIKARHGIPEYGFEARPPVWSHAIPEYDPKKHADYMVFLVWEGPQGDTPFWPHAIAPKEEPTVLGTEADEAEFCGVDVKDYRDLVSGDPERMARVGDPAGGSTDDFEGKPDAS